MPFANTNIEMSLLASWGIQQFEAEQATQPGSEPCSVGTVHLQGYESLQISCGVSSLVGSYEKPKPNRINTWIF